jgi:pimeloyl-ACP methyl ester carboxylesterase
MPEFTIKSATAETVTLPLPVSDRQFADTRKQGVVSLLWESGYGRLGEVIEEGSDDLVRRLELVSGELPRAGDEARLENYIYRGSDPLEAHGLAFEDLFMSGEAGRLHAWWLQGEADTAILMLHGRRRADLSETLRIMPTLVELGYPVLALAYRNHDQSDMNPDGFYHYGASEWQDLVTGLQYLTAQGFEDVIIYSYSLGSAVTLEAVKVLRDDPSLSGVTVHALIMDSPFIDPRTIFRQGAKNRGLPLANQLADSALWIAARRSGVEWKLLDQRLYAATFSLPLLLIHGAEDQTTPVTLIDEFSDTYAGSLEYLRVDEADHTEAWNKDPEGYEARVRSFLSEVVQLRADR